MNERIRKLRKTLDLTQKSFGERIGVKGNTIAQYEMGRNEPIDAVISLICREYNVREQWLRTGEGEMFRDLSKDEQIAGWMGEVLADEPESFRRCFVQLLSGFEAEDWLMLERHLLNLQQIIKQRRENQD